MIRYLVTVVDDEESIRDGLDLLLSDDYDIDLYETAELFLENLNHKLPDLVLMDIGLPKMSGIEALELVKESHPDLPVIMITAFEDINMVIRTMKQGAFDFILKPINPDILELTIEKAIESISLRKEVKVLQEKYLKESQPCFIAESQKIEDVMDFINLVSKSPDTPIMIMGETGTGKELIARAIHARSPVFKGPFIPVNCSAFPEDLIESELFGYEGGAFSGAKKKGKRGFIEEADGGTLFLDEVADLSLAGQAKLLRFLESGEFYKVGSTKLNRVKTRVVSATNKNLEKLIEKELFRRDLFFRLCVVKADIPSLNERPEDIVALAKHFLYEFNNKFDKKIKGIETVAMELLKAHNFTGNVRELKNIIERSVLISKGNKIDKDDLGLVQETVPEVTKAVIRDIEIPKNGIDLNDMLVNLEKSYLEEALKIAKNNESKAARLLNMNHHTFRYKLKKIGKE